MSYVLGIDLGTTYTSAAVVADGRAEVVQLGLRSSVVPTVVFLTEDGQMLTGETANRRGVTAPARVAREFKRRVGDTAPLLLGGTPMAPQALMASMLRWVIDQVTAEQGASPAHVAVSHPANWGPYKLGLLEQAVRLADLESATTITEPEAAARYYASTQRLSPGDIVVVYDLGGGTFDAAVLEATPDGFEILGTPEGIEHLGGIDIDEAVFGLVARELGGALEGLDPDDPLVTAGAARLRRDCVEAKEALSSDTEVRIPVMLPSVQTEVRITRGELETLVRPTLVATIGALERALRSAHVRPDQLAAVLLVGGTSRMPVVSQLVSEALGRRVAVDTHPKHAVSLGTALEAETAYARERGAARPAAEIVPPRDTPPVPPGALTPALDVPPIPAGQSGARSRPTLQSATPTPPPPMPPPPDSPVSIDDDGDDEGDGAAAAGIDWRRLLYIGGPLLVIVIVAAILIATRGGDGDDGGDGGGAEVAAGAAGAASTASAPVVVASSEPPAATTIPATAAGVAGLDSIAPTSVAPAVTSSSPDVETTESRTELVASVPPAAETTGQAAEPTQPVVATAEPYVATTEPVVTTEPYVATTEAQVETTEPVATTEPYVETTEPVATTEPYVETTASTAAPTTTTTVAPTTTSTTTTTTTVAPTTVAPTTIAPTTVPGPSAQIAALSVGRRVPVGEFPDGVEADADGRLWTASSFGDRLTRLDPVTGRQDAITFEADSKPLAVASSPDAIYVTLLGSDQLARVHPETLAVELLAVSDQPAFLAWGAGSLWSVSDGGWVDRIDPATFTVSATIEVPGAKGVAVVGDSAWVTAGSTNELVEIGLASNGVVARYPIGTGPDAIVADGNAVWVANRGEGTVARFDTIYQQVTARVATGTAPSAISIDGDRVWVVDIEEGTLVLVDRPMATVVETIVIGRQPLGVEAAGGEVWVSAAGDDVLAEVQVWAEAPTGPSAQLVGVEMVGGRYIPTFAAQNFTPSIGGDFHVHIYWNSAPVADVGVPGTEPWLVWDLPERVDDPFFDIANRPADANAVCIVVANAAHEIADVDGDGAVDYDTGNCVQLPDAAT